MSSDRKGSLQKGQNQAAEQQKSSDNAVLFNVHKKLSLPLTFPTKTANMGWTSASKSNSLSDTSI